MPRRFPSDTKHKPDDASAAEPLIDAEETTHRYSSNALAEIRSAIAQAQAGVETVAPVAAPTGRMLPEAVPSWSPALPPMAATEAPGATEVTQRYADRSVAGIRAAIAAAREAEAGAPPTRAAARFAGDEAPVVKVPSMILDPRTGTLPDDADRDDKPGPQ